MNYSIFVVGSVTLGPGMSCLLVSERGTCSYSWVTYGCLGILRMVMFMVVKMRTETEAKLGVNRVIPNGKL
jgi:hypothetical protein